MSADNVLRFGGEGFRPPQDSPGGGAGGNDGGMDARIAVLEFRAELVEKQLDRFEQKLDRLLDAQARLSESIARLEGRVEALPTSWRIAAIVAGIGASLIVGALSAAKYLLPLLPLLPPSQISSTFR